MSTADAYKKHTHREHILELPDTYIGSVETHDEMRWVFDKEKAKMVYRHCAFNPGFYKLFDEIVVNARDALVRSSEAGKTPIKHIEVSVVPSSGGLLICVENDGDGIPIEQHPTEKVFVPEMIFGHLLTSGNYNKEEEKIVGGKNGYGAKLTNIFSHTFTVETRSPKHGLKYTQTWRDHMLVCDKACVKKDAAKTGFVKITYQPDLSRFVGLNIAEMTEVLHTRCVELAALAGKEVKVSWNGETVATNTFEKFVRLFVKDGAVMAYEKCSDRWEVAAVLTRTLFDDEDNAADEKHVSFVNAVNTRKGGKHVDAVTRIVLGDFCELAAKKKKLDIKVAQLKDAVMFFVNSTIVNPSFDSQTKECLTTPATKFGSAFKTGGKLVEGLVKIGLMDEAQNILDAKAAKDAKKTDGKKRTTLRGMPKLVDALWAGSSKSSECTLILTEGDSAATSAITGLKVVGREAWGVFPLKGKMLNVRDVSADKFSKNEELTAIKKILGLEQSKVYKDLKTLRYGRVMVMADQDLDGSHIKGLLMNLFHTEWPSLMKAGFVCSLMTPLLKASRRGEVVSFYSQGEFDSWRETHELKGWTLKYYKGLGTSTPEEAQEWFRALHEIKYRWDESTDESLSLAFSKKRADDRKKWLAGYDPQRLLVVGEGGAVAYSRFINDELIHFSNADNIRSLPHLIDGLKPSQRKILFGCLKRGLTSEIRVAQLAGYVSEHAAYHHGEASLTGAITSMAQTFVGSNNINLLAPVGQFGSRLMGGKDAASPRYIHTHLEPIVSTIFRKEDNGVLKYLDDDGLAVEPECYWPVVPLLLVNGSVGIGTGFSTDIPPFNPNDIIALLRDRLEGRRETLEQLALQPWWLGFRGRMTMLSDGVWQTRGQYTFDDEKKIVSVTELPVGTWTNDYKAFLDELCTNKDLEAGKMEDGKPVLLNYDDLYNHVDVRFDLYLDSYYYEEAKRNMGEFEKRFRLTTTWRTSNMVCFDTNTKIVRYSCVGDILESFYGPRLATYEERRQSEMNRLLAEAVEADAKARFIHAVLEGTLELRRATDESLVAAMRKHELPPLSGKKELENIDSYDYLLRLRMDRVKATAVADAEEMVARARAAVAELAATTASQMWLRDLADFEIVWLKMREQRETALQNGGAAPPKKKKFKLVTKA
jgi:DNA topoisomerase-2